MSKKILTVLAPVAAIVAFMAIPSLAQATQLQCGASECAVNAVVKGQSSNLKTQVQTAGVDEGELKCTSSEFEGKATVVQAETVEGSVTKDVLSGCTAKGLPADITTSASVANPWTLKVQQPDASGNVTAHLSGSITFQVQVQFFGFSVAHCTFTAQGSIQLTGTAQSDTSSVSGNEQFLLTGSNSEECGTLNETVGDLSGSFQLETAAGSAVVVHMS